MPLTWASGRGGYSDWRIREGEIALTILSLRVSLSIVKAVEGQSGPFPVIVFAGRIVQYNTVHGRPPKHTASDRNARSRAGETSLGSRLNAAPI